MVGWCASACSGAPGAELSLRSSSRRPCREVSCVAGVRVEEVQEAAAAPGARRQQRGACRSIYLHLRVLVARSAPPSR